MDYVAIANMALQQLGEDDRISAPDEDSRAARAVATAWEGNRIAVLTEAHWSFALRTVELAARPADPLFPIALGFTPFPMPADLLALVEILEPRVELEDDSYSIEAGPSGGEELLIGTSGPITIRYTRDTALLKDPANWSPAFVEAFAFRLAWQIAEAMGSGKGAKDRAYGAWGAAIKKAKRANARKKASQERTPGPWELARRGHGRTRAPGV